MLILAAAALPASGQTEPAAAPPAAESPAEKPDPRELFEEWKRNDPALEKDKSACVMCAGFGLVIVCGKSCDSTGLTIRKANGTSNAWCGRCDSGKWEK
jgi:hypothetical protein